MITTRPVPRLWTAEAVLVVGTGPSLAAEDLALWGDRPMVVINDAWRLAPAADVLYACDAGWWNLHQGAAEFRGERWTQAFDGDNDDKAQLAAAERWRLNVVLSKPGAVVSDDPTWIGQGHSSGHQALNWAVLAGGNPILLTGFDNAGDHYFGQHPSPLPNPDPTTFNSWEAAHQAAAQAYAARGVAVFNCSRQTALTGYPKRAIEEFIR